MTIHVYSARISYRGPDRLDVTRKSGKEGLFQRAILRSHILPKLGAVDCGEINPKVS